jgi:hypothetical protein
MAAAQRASISSCANSKGLGAARYGDSRSECGFRTTHSPAVLIIPRSWVRAPPAPLYVQIQQGTSRESPAERSSSVGCAPMTTSEQPLVMDDIQSYLTVRRQPAEVPRREGDADDGRRRPPRAPGGVPGRPARCLDRRQQGLTGCTGTSHQSYPQEGSRRGSRRDNPWSSHLRCALSSTGHHDADAGYRSPYRHRSGPV